jgi:hypothetical protein
MIESETETSESTSYFLFYLVIFTLLLIAALLGLEFARKAFHCTCARDIKTWNFSYRMLHVIQWVDLILDADWLKPLSSQCLFAMLHLVAFQIATASLIDLSSNFFGSLNLECIPE